MTTLFLPGVPEDLIRAALGRAGGNEIASGKFASPESSAALAANAFGWFLEAPGLLPALPGCGDLDWPAVEVRVEREMRLPWSGGRHPWLDAAIETETNLIGVESKRFEPFRGAKPARLSEAYDRDVWGGAMRPWLAMRDRLRADPTCFRHLDAAQLVKHAMGLITEGGRIGKAPMLCYLFAEPAGVPDDSKARHRAEVAAFAEAVKGAIVRFVAGTYREWLAGWHGKTADHAAALSAAFGPL